MKYIAAIDQGTTGTRTIIFDHAGSVVSSHYEEHRQIYPQPGWVEHDAREIWVKTSSTITSALAKLDSRATELAAIGITNQRETTVVWNPKTGQPYQNAIVWQDTRTQNICQHLKDEGKEKLIRDRTGLPIATYFSAPKLQWLLENVPGLRERAQRGDAVFGNMDTWVIWNLTGGVRGGAHVTDYTNASRTMLLDLRTLDWDEELLQLFRIPRQTLPRILPSSNSQTFGYSDARGPFGKSVPISGDLGDQQAALFGQVAFDRGDAKNTYGTGCFLLSNTGSDIVPSRSGLLTTIASRGETCYALEGSIAIAGAAVQWLRDNLRLITNAAETEEIASSVVDTGGVYFVPAFNGLFAPHWDMYARGTLVGLTRYSTRAHIVRATLEAIAYQTREVIEAMETDSGVKLTSLKVDGGAVRNNFLMQLQADILGARVVRPTVNETTALGAAYAAGLALGFWKSLDELRRNWGVDRTFEPQWDAARREAGYAEWRRAIERAKGWAHV